MSTDDTCQTGTSEEQSGGVVATEAAVGSTSWSTRLGIVSCKILIPYIYIYI